MLRGWRKYSWNLVERPYNYVQNLSQDEFQMLLLCDGETDFTESMLTESMQKALRQLETEQIVEPCAERHPLEKEQYYKFFDNQYVSTILWSITGRCNYRCRHCFMDAPNAASGELSTDEMLDLIDQMAECGVLRVDLTGGEPLVRKDFWQLIDYMVLHRIAVSTVYTNGWLINSKILDEFERRGLKPRVSISFDGIKWHDWMRGIPGAEQAALKALQLCTRRNFTSDVEMCIHRGNLHTLSQTVHILHSVGVRGLKVSKVSASTLWLKHSEGNELSEKEYIESMIRYIPQFYAAGCPMELTITNVIKLHRDGTYEVIAERYDGTETCLDCYLCSAVRWTCYLTPQGRLLPCMPMTSSPAQELFPRVQDIGLKQGLTDSFYMQFVDGRVKNLLEANAECNACAYRYKCGGGCRANALIEGDQKLMGCDRNMCMLWKEGYVERIRKAADDAIAKYGVPSKKGGSSEVDT